MRRGTALLAGSITVLMLTLALSPAAVADRAAPNRRAGTDAVHTQGSPWVFEFAPTPSNCPSGWVCMWSNNGFNGNRCRVEASFYAGGGWQNFGGSADRICELDQPFFNNDMQSWKNNSNKDAQWAEGVDGSGDVRCMNDGGQNTSVTSPNTATSVRVRNNNTTC